DGTEGIHTLGKKELRAGRFRRQGIQVLLGKRRRLPCDSDAGRRPAVRLHSPFLNVGLIFRNTHHVDSVPASLLVAQYQARAVMRYDFLQASADGGEK